MLTENDVKRVIALITRFYKVPQDQKYGIQCELDAMHVRLDHPVKPPWNDFNPGDVDGA